MNKDTVYRRDVIDTLIPLPGIGRKAIDKVNSLPPADRWIPCSEGLPKEEGFYLVTLKDKCGAETTIRFFRIENGERHWSLWGNENITAWMPKPEPYKGVTT